MSTYPTGDAGIVNLQQMMLDFLGQTEPAPQTGAGGLINIQILLQQIIDGGGLGGGGMVPPNSTGITSFTTSGVTGTAATYDPATGDMNVPDYSVVPPGSTGIGTFSTNNGSGPATYSASTGALNVPVYAPRTLNQRVIKGPNNYVATGTTIHSTGFGLPFTANTNPCVRISYNFFVTYSTASTVPGIYILRTTDPIPAAGTDLTGTSDVYICQTRQLNLINTWNSMTGAFLDTTLAVGTPYNYYVAMNSANAGPATLISDGLTGIGIFEIK